MHNCNNTIQIVTYYTELYHTINYITIEIAYISYIHNNVDIFLLKHLTRNYIFGRLLDDRIISLRGKVGPVKLVYIVYRSTCTKPGH